MLVPLTQTEINTLISALARYCQSVSPDESLSENELSGEQLPRFLEQLRRCNAAYLSDEFERLDRLGFRELIQAEPRKNLQKLASMCHLYGKISERSLYQIGLADLLVGLIADQFTDKYSPVENTHRILFLPLLRATAWAFDLSVPLGDGPDEGRIYCLRQAILSRAALDLGTVEEGEDE